MSKPTPDPAYGRHRPALWIAGLRDRLQGQGHRARARWGRIRPPPGDEPLVWLRAPAGRDDVEVAVALMQALRETRSDTRLVLTYHEEHQDLLEAGLKGLQRMGFGYGPCDAGRAVRRVLARLQPSAVIPVGEPAPRNLAHALKRRAIRHIPYATPHGDYGRHTADPLALLLPAQVEPTLGGLLRGGRTHPLWWWHGLADRAVLQAWLRHGREALLVVSGDPAWKTLAQHLERPVLTFSQWDRRREAVPPGSLLVVDEERWLPALAVSADATHLEQPRRRPLLQALAAGRPLSLGEGTPPLALDGLEAPRLRGPVAVLERWMALHRAPFAARSQGDTARRVFWEHRRRAQQRLERLREDYRHW